MKRVSKAVGNRRLLKLAAFLRAVPPERFNYNRWVGIDWAGAQDLSCGTTGCALGWAATMPTFRRLGLHLSKCGEPVVRRTPNAYAAARRLFCLDIEDSHLLFCPNDGEEHATPTYVAQKIERFVKARSA